MVFIELSILNTLSFFLGVEMPASGGGGGYLITCLLCDIGHAAHMGGFDLKFHLYGSIFNLHPGRWVAFSECLSQPKKYE